MCSKKRLINTLIFSLIFTIIQTKSFDTRKTSNLENEPNLRKDIDVNFKAYNVSNSDDFEVELVSVESSDIYPNPSHFGVKAGKKLEQVVAYVGILLSYPIPDYAFKGAVSLSFPQLPVWLWYNREHKMLQGIPPYVGEENFTVVGHGVDGSVATNNLVVSLKSLEDTRIRKEGGCSRSQKVTFLTLNVGPFKKVDPKTKTKAVKAISKILDVQLSKIALTPKTEVETMPDFPIFDDFLNNNLVQHYKDNSLWLSLVAGCDGQPNEEGKMLLQEVKDIVDYGENKSGIRAWFLRNGESVHRTKRQADVEGSGDLSNDPDDYYEEYEDFFQPYGPGVSSTPSVSPGIPSPTKEPEGKNFDLASKIPDIIPSRPSKAEVPVTPTLRPDDFITSRPDFEMDGSGDGPHLDSSILVHPTVDWSDRTTPLIRPTSIIVTPSKTINPHIVASTTSPDHGETATEIVVKNFPPRVDNRIRKLGWTAGTVYRMQIPADTFVDFEDGDTRNLSLVLKDENGDLFTRNSWIQIDPTNQQVYALPLEKHIGRYDFRLEALDSGRQSATDYLEVNVWQHKQVRIFHHQFTAVLKKEKKYEYDFVFALDWQVKAVEKIAALFGDKSLDNINVRNITYSENSPVIITWSNVSLVNSLSNECPTEQLKRLIKIMFVGHGPEASRTAKRVFMPEFTLKSLDAKFYDPCEHDFHWDHHSDPHHPITPRIPDIGYENSAPIFRNQIDLLQATAGHLFRYKVPENVCYDLEDGNSYELKMRMLTIELATPPKTLWVQFDVKNQEFFGIPLQSDIGRREYLLECQDSGGKSVSEALVIEALPSDSTGPKPALFSIKIDTPYELFMSTPHDKARFIERLGAAFDDPNADKNVEITSMEEGSVVIKWHNVSLPNDPCPYEEVQRLKDVMTDSNGQLKRAFKEKFLPDFKILNAEAVSPSGSCLSPDTPTYTESPEEDDGELGGTGEVQTPGEEDYLLTFVIPAVLIAALLLLAALIACCLYRRRRYGKMSMMRSHNGGENQTFVTKGIPVIFAEELDDQRPENAKSPVIMKDEKPPLPPPEYQRSTPPRDAQRPSSGVEINLSDEGPYHRPPPFAATNGSARNQRPNLPPAYRKLPNYVLP